MGVKNIILSLIWVSTILGCTQKASLPLEELDRIGVKMSQQAQIEYAYDIKMFRSYAGDTICFQGKMYFELYPKDTAIGYIFYHQIPDEKSFYNGDALISLLSKDSSAYRKLLCDYQDGHMTLHPYLELSYGAIKLFLTNPLFASMTDSLTRKDTIFQEHPCTAFSFWADNQLIDTHKKTTGRSKVKLVFRKKDDQPVFYATYQPLKNNNYLYHEASFSDYSFANPYPDAIFAIENIPTYYQWDKHKNSLKTIPAGTRAPEWKLPRIDGDSVPLSAFRGKYVLLDFWFIGCGACIESIPTLNQLKSTYKDNLEVIGVNCFDKDIEKIRKYCVDHEMIYQNVWKGDIISDEYKINAAPIFYLIDQNGVIIDTQIGYDAKKLKNMVASINLQTI